MKQLNMMVEDDVKDAAVAGAKQDGMLLNKWVSRAILERRARQQESAVTQEMIRQKLAEESSKPALGEPVPVWENEMLSDLWIYSIDGTTIGEVQPSKEFPGRWEARFKGELVTTTAPDREYAMRLVREAEMERANA